jgi:hypothetical protein
MRAGSSVQRLRVLTLVDLEHVSHPLPTVFLGIGAQDGERSLSFHPRGRALRKIFVGETERFATAQPRML